MRKNSSPKQVGELSLACMVYFPSEGLRGIFLFHKLCLHMHVHKTKFKRTSSLEYYHMTFIGKTKHTCYKRGLFN